MIRKNELKLIDEFCMEYNFNIIYCEFFKVKTEEPISTHSIILRKNTKNIMFEKRTIYDFDNDNMGVIWVVDEVNYIDSLFSLLEYIDKKYGDKNESKNKQCGNRRNT